MSDSHSIQVGDRGVIRCNGSAMDGQRCVVGRVDGNVLIVEYDRCLALVWHTDFEKDDTKPISHDGQMFRDACKGLNDR